MQPWKRCLKGTNPACQHSKLLLLLRAMCCAGAACGVLRSVLAWARMHANTRGMAVEAVLQAVEPLLCCSQLLQQVLHSVRQACNCVVG
jgi:hypothetical protein